MASSDGEHGILYVCDARGVHAQNELLGRRVTGVFGGYDQCVAVVDSGELEWQGKTTHRRDVLEQESVALGLSTQSVRVQQLAFGENHRVALATDGRLFSWGRRGAAFSNGELGQVAASWHPVTLTPRELSKDAASKQPHPQQQPQQDEGGDDEEFTEREGAGADDICRPHRVHCSKDLVVCKIACGSHHSIALTDKGDLYAWGRNSEGQLGHGAVTRSADANRLYQGMSAWPKYVGALLGRPPVTDVCCGQRFTIVLLRDGSVLHFGERITGTTHCAAADRVDARPHTLITRGTDGAPFVSIAAGFMHALMVTQAGELFAWG
ncbi:hypothetical protein PINS_up013000 [Pythium insidiosum]|nr:hypothetical protein PINS_up013000 [Pythium insidiosum]